jgi:hypothetical protein
MRANSPLKAQKETQMISRRNALGLSLLCALAFCAFAAPSAFAAKGTTAKTCVKVGPEHVYADAHCGKKTGGEFELEDTITPGTKTAIVGTNAKTKNNTTESKNPVLTAESLGVKVKLEGITVVTTGEIENKAGPPMSTEGQKIFVAYRGVRVIEPAGCTVNSPGKPVEEITTTELVGVSGTMNETTGEMSGIFKPKNGNIIAVLEFHGATCGLPNTNVEGFVEATNPNGEATPKASPTAEGAATYTFEGAAMSHLTVLGGAATYTGAETVSMSAGNPIAVVTTAT